MANCAIEVAIIKLCHWKCKCLMNPRCSERGLGDGSGGKVLAVQAGGPEFDPPEPTQLCQAQWHGLIILVLGRWIQMYPWGLLCGQSSLLGEYQAKERLVSKTKVTDVSQLKLSKNAYTHTWTVTRKSGRVNIRNHKDDK